MVKLPVATFSSNVMGISDCMYATKETGCYDSKGICKSSTSSWGKSEYKKGMENTTREVPRSGSSELSANSVVDEGIVFA
jgi:hypothetical protein